MTDPFARLRDQYHHPREPTHYQDSPLFAIRLLTSKVQWLVAPESGQQL